MMGVVAATQDIKTLLRLPVLLIYLGAILWTVGYDTIYAVQDRADDAKLGIFSTALLFGQKTREITLSLYLSSGGLILLGALLEGMSFFSYPVIIMSYLWMSYQLWILNLEEREACRDFFIKNQWVGTSIFLAFML
jgi:4-hydroxybenzoate polyprenyltransferase